MMNPPGKISLRLILTRVARSLPTKHCALTTQPMTSRGAQMLSTSAPDLTLWSLLLKAITPTLIDMADSLISLRSPSTTKAQRKSLADPRDRRFKSSGYAGLSRTLQAIRMGSLTFASHNCNLLNQMVQQNGTVLSHHLMFYVPLT